eukprot:TRINITY_DN3272_c0_g1_i1.p1 TRINITY_DN3272_c0_g1~~TRINITY_DN3272_c0_g1_i1.p1  ORF type:complete len:157 (-),score=26.12 TRINITY_DN3272_c0_g1_i1:1414-1884(-)
MRMPFGLKTAFHSFQLFKDPIFCRFTMKSSSFESSSKVPSPGGPSPSNTSWKHKSRPTVTSLEMMACFSMWPYYLPSKELPPSYPNNLNSTRVATTSPSTSSRSVDNAPSNASIPPGLNNNKLNPSLLHIIYNNSGPSATYMINSSSPLRTEVPCP